MYCEANRWYIQRGNAMKEIYFAIGKRIREIRKKQSLTLEELSERANLNWSFVARIETGKAVASVESLVKIAQALNVPVKDLFSTTAIRQEELLDRQAGSLIQQLKTSDKSHLVQILRLILSTSNKNRKK
jgi:transcriptional regulator with XRE-family HTH domain